MAKRASIFVSVAFGGQSPSTKLSTLKNSGEVLSSSALSGVMKRSGGASGVDGLARYCDKRLDPITRLNRLDVVHVYGGKELGPVNDEGEVSLRPDHRLDAGWRFAMPVRARQQEFARVIARGPGPDIGEVEGVHVDELERIVTVLLDCRHGDHQRLGAQVRAEKRIGRIRVWRLDRLVVGRGDPRIADHTIPRPLEFGIAAIDEIRILDAIAVDEREAVDGRFLGDGSRLIGRELVSACRSGCEDERRGGESEGSEEAGRSLGIETCDRGARCVAGLCTRHSDLRPPASPFVWGA